MKISIVDLEKAFKMLMQALSRSDLVTENSNEIEFAYDFYWTISVGERDVSLEKPEAGVGSIDHDIERIQQFITEKEPMRQHFRYLGDILIAIEDTLDVKNIWL